MGYPQGLPTPDGIISLIITGLKIYREARQADHKYEAAKQLLDSLDSALCVLEEVIETIENNGTLRTQVGVARKAWQELDHYLVDFEPQLGRHNANSGSVRLLKRLKWAYDELDGRLSSLYIQIQLCFSAVMPMLLISMLPESTGHRSNNDVPSSEPESATVRNQDMECAIIPCWKRKRGCMCRCHTTSRVTSQLNTHFCVDVAGFPWLFRICNIGTCNSRRYTLQMRFAASKYGLPFAFRGTFDFSKSWLPKFSLAPPQTICRYTSPGFSKLWELEKCCYSQFERSQKMSEIKRLLTTGDATFRDIDPSGEGWLDKILQYPWGSIDDQWELIEFLVTRSPKDVLDNPRLLYKCAGWIGEGPHMELLDALLSLGVDPGSTNAMCFHDWPSFSSPGWISETITPDPMFVEWMQACLRREPGYAGCDALSESVLTGSTSEFERVLEKSKDSNGIPQVSENAFGQTAVHLAIIFPARLKQLLEAGVDPDLGDHGGSTPLIYAACYGYSESVRYLMNYTRHPMHADQRNRRVFIDYAIRRHHIDVIETVVQTLRAQGSNESAMIVLDRCLRYYFGSGSRISEDFDLAMLDRLFSLGADPDVHNGRSSLLHLASTKTGVRRVLKAGFTAVDSADEQGITPLMKVLPFFDAASTKQLIERGADVNSQDQNGWTALHHSMQALLRHFDGRLGDLDDHEFKQWVDTVSNLHLVFKSGADIRLRDQCRCACSAGGCSTITMALHRTVRKLGSMFGGRISLVLVDLLSLLENRTPSNLEQYFQDLKRYRAFFESDLEHTCCYWKEDSPYAGKHSDQVNYLQHSKFNASYEESNAELISTRHYTIQEVARLFKIIEKRAEIDYRYETNRYASGVSQECFQIPYEIDEKNDRFIERYSGLIMPQLSTLDLGGLRSCLARARISLPSLGLQQRGSLNAYIDNALSILSEIEKAMQDL